MSEQKPAYNTRGNRTTYELTPAEAKIVEWIRRNSNGRWLGTVVYVADTNTYQMFDGKQAGVTNGRN